MPEHEAHRLNGVTGTTNFDHPDPFGRSHERFEDNLWECDNHSGWIATQYGHWKDSDGDIYLRLLCDHEGCLGHFQRMCQNPDHKRSQYGPVQPLRAPGIAPWDEEPEPEPDLDPKAINMASPLARRLRRRTS